MKKTTKRKYTKKAKEPELAPAELEIESETDLLETYMADVSEKLGKIADALTGQKGERYLATLPDALENIAKAFNKLKSELAYMSRVQDQLLRCLALITQTPGEYIKLPKFTSENELRELVNSILRLQKDNDTTKKLPAATELEELEIGG